MARPDADRFPDVARHIACMECGGTAHLLTPLPAEDDLYPGDILVYRCADCLERWDVVYDPNGELA